MDRAPDALSANELMIGWSNVPGLLNKSLEWLEFRQIMHDEYYSDNDSFRSAGSAAGNMWRFIREMENGDLVVVPHGSAFYVAEVSAEAYHISEKIAEDTAFRRPVNWLNDKKPIPRSIARLALQSRLKIQNTCADATDIIALIEDALEVCTNEKPPTFDSDLRDRLKREALVEIRSGRIENFGFENLLKTVLLGMGATKASVVPRNLDKGADILATFSIADSFDVVLAVQAKHFQPEPPVNKEIVDQLIRGMEAEDADLGWVATSGTFSEEAKVYVDKVREESGHRIELIDREHLACLIVEMGLQKVSE